MKEIIVEVWGEFACFTQPYAKVERLTYAFPTPSAARGILSAIYNKPKEFYYQINRIEILKLYFAVSDFVAFRVGLDGRDVKTAPECRSARPFGIPSAFAIASLFLRIPSGRHTGGLEATSGA